MLRYCLAGSLLFALVLVGCQAPTPEKDAAASSHPITAAEFSRIRDSYEHGNPNVKVGLVEAVDPSAMLAAVGNVTVSDFSVRDVISFVDSSGRTVANGFVHGIDNSLLMVQYQTPAGGRAPQMGDLAIRAIK